MKIYTEIIGNLQDPEWVKKAREAEIEYIDLDQWTAQKAASWSKATGKTNTPWH